MPQKFGRGDMDDIRPERLEIGARLRGQSAAELILATPSDHREGGHIDEIAGRRKSGFGDGRRIDANGYAAVQQMPDQEVERLVGAVAHIIVIAAEQRDAKL